MTNELIYCEKCKHYRLGDNCGHAEVISRYPTPIHMATDFGSCIKLNKNNDCPRYEQYRLPSPDPSSKTKNRQND